MRGCRECGEANPERARFCLACGSALGAKDGHARASRRIVTVLFCDVVGSTTMGDVLDPESVRTMMSLFFARARSALERHGGTVEKFIGDAVVGAFGVPDLHEDDAVRGVRAAVDLQAAVADLNVEFGRRWGRAIGVRIGVNTGEVVAGDTTLGQAFLTGDAVNVAARLEQAAAEGEILVGEATRRLVSRAAVLAAVDPLRLRGKTQPVPAWRLVGLAAHQEAADGLGSGWVGRDRELAHLSATFEQSASQRSCRALTVVGAPGVGKTRLVSEFARWVRPHATVVNGRCLPYGQGINFWPLVEVLRDLVGVGVDDQVAGARTKIAAFLPDESSSHAVVEAILGVLGLAAPSARDETFWGVRRLLEVAAARRPLVTVLDDVHWAEPTMLDLVEHLVEWSHDAPIMIVALARPEVRTAWAAPVEDRPAWDCLRLDPLGTDESRLLAESLLGRTADRDLVDHVVRVAEGNPLFVEEILRMLVDDGVLLHQRGAWRRGDEAAPLAVPASIQSLLAARLDRLAEDDRVVVERASVVGRQFFRSPLVELSPGPVGERIDEHLAVLVARELVAHDQSTWPSEDAYRFSHLLIRDAAYLGLLKHERAALHERMARWLEDHAGDLPEGEMEDLLAYHLEQAHTYLGQLGTLDEHGRELGRRAAGHLQGGARRAMARGDYPAAATLLRRARSQLPRQAPAGPAVLLELAECTVAAGDVRGAGAALDDLSDLVADLPDRLGAGVEARLAVARCELRMLSEPGRLQGDVAAVRTAVAALAAAGDAGPLAHALTVLGRALALLGRLAEAEVALDRALVQARRADDAARARQVLLQLPLIALWGPLPVTKANGRLTDTLRVLRLRPGNRGVEAEALRCMGLLEAMRARFDAARSLLASAERAFHELGSPVGLGEVDCSSGLVELMADNPDPACLRLESAYSRFTAQGAAAGAGRAAGWLAESRWRQRDWEDAARWADVAAMLSGGGQTRDAVVWLGVQAKLTARRGDLAAAQALARDAAAGVEATDALVDRADALLNLAEVLQSGGRTAEADVLSRRAQAFYAAKGHVIGAARAARGP
ncbi:MAG: ATP-binding protein [Kineosporiaceae bacterium]